MKKTTYALAGAALVVLGIAGFGIAQASTTPATDTSSSASSVDPTSETRDGATVTDPSDSPSASATPVDDGIAPVELTVAGAICDMRSLYTHECDIKYPKTGFLNGVHRSSRDAESVTDAEWLSYGAKSCAGYAAGGNVQTIHTVPEAVNAATDIASNDQVVNSAAQNILCPEFANR